MITLLFMIGFGVVGYYIGKGEGDTFTKKAESTLGKFLGA